LVITLTFSQEIKQKDNVIDYQNAWWYPILKTHNVEPRGFNTFKRIFEMGTKNSINNDKVVTLENAFILTEPDSNGYFILKSPLAYHDLDKNRITGDDGIIERYNPKSEDIKPIESLHLKNFIIQFGGTKPNIEAKEIESVVSPKK
jgi:hypothetical protein